MWGSLFWSPLPQSCLGLRRKSGSYQQSREAPLRADAAESALCAYLALVALVGLGINAIWHVTWADPVAALVIVPVILREGREALRGEACGCC
jgi:divalent metal cation (Fe/Co/Zn/Cd) transporter